MAAAQIWEQVLCWLLIYLIGYCQGWAWILLLPLMAYYFLPINRYFQEKEDTAEPSKPNTKPSGLPQWVLHPDIERIEWLNGIISQLWPQLDGLFKQVLKKIEEDDNLCQRLQGYHIRCLKFPQGSLGNVPPRLGGIKFHPLCHRDEIILDLDVEYAGDLQIALEATLLDDWVPAVTASLSNMTLNGAKLRLHLRPLLSDIPFVGGINISFLSCPQLDFDLGGVASVLELPGISLLLRHLIHDQLEQTFVMPNSYTLSLLPEADLQNLINQKVNARGEMSPLSLPQGVLSVHLIEAKNLMSKDFGRNTSDPYAVCRVEVDRHVHRYKTSVVDNTLHPTWNMLLDLPVDEESSLKDISVEVWDQDRVGNDDTLGKCVVPAQLLRTAIHKGDEGPVDVWKQLEDTKSGSVHLEIGWSLLSPIQPPSLQNDQDYHVGVVSIFVDSCLGLLTNGNGSFITGFQLPNPKVSVEVCQVSQTTVPVIGSTDPVFEHRMNFLVTDPRCDRVQIFVKDDRCGDELMGWVYIPLSEVLAHPSLSITQGLYELSDHDIRSSSAGSKKQIRLSLAFRYIHRPCRQRRFASHHSLEDLPRIYKNSDLGEELELKEAENQLQDQDEDEKEDLKSVEITENLPVIVPTAAPSPALTVRKMPNPSAESCKIQLSLKYDPRTATLSIVVHRLRNLWSEPKTGSYYVKVRLIERIGDGSSGRSLRVSHSKRKTTAQKRTANSTSIDVVFEETLSYLLPPHELKMRRLETCICLDSIGRSAVISRCIVALDSLLAVLSQGGSGTPATVTDWYSLPSTIKG